MTERIVQDATPFLAGYPPLRYTIRKAGAYWEVRMPFFAPEIQFDSWTRAFDYVLWDIKWRSSIV